MIYLPREDTYFFIDALADYGGHRACEIGCGIGLALLELSKRFGLVVGTDLDLESLLEAKESLKKSGVENVELIACDKAEAFRDGVFDLVAFNPPYLPSEGLGDRCVEGGPRGYESALEFARSGERRLVDGGRLLLLASSLSDLEGLLKGLSGLGLECRIKARRRLFFEELFALECSRRANFDDVAI
ncbi:MAG: methyltransferase [Thaumarchaeota archaeon]|nr:methyltransferase [Nitrososphaerota archaeon]